MGCDHLHTEPMHHFAPDGEDFGPTGYLICQDCGAVIWGDDEDQGE
jgi:hypothetical protein